MSAALPLWQPAYIALGSNLDDPRAQVLRAIEQLRTLPRSRLCAVSRLYRTPPMGPQDQPDFVNAAAGIVTELTPRDLLDILLDIERAFGRERRERWGPRIIDLDLVCFDSRVIDEPGLQLPHPGISERNFVLYPLNDIARDLLIPNHGRVAELAARCDRGALKVMD